MRVGKRPEASRRKTPTSGARGFIWGALLLYLVFLAATAIWSSRSSSAWDPLTWKPDTSNWILQTAGQLSVVALRDVALFGPLAFLCAAAWSRPDRTHRWLDVLISLAAGFAISLALAFVLKAVMNGQPLHAPNIVVIVFLAIVCLGGSWAGATWSRTHNIGRWLFGQLVSIPLIIAAVGFSLAWFGLETQPLEIVGTPIGGEDRVRLVKVMRGHDPRDVDVGETTKLTFNQRDLNQLLTWGLSLLSGNQIAVIDLQADRVSLSLTGELPPIPVFHRRVNIITAGKPITENGELGFAPRELRIGRIHVPDWLLEFSGPLMIEKDWCNDNTRPFFSSLQQVSVDDGQVTLAYGHFELPAGFVRDAMVGIGVMKDVAPTVQARTPNSCCRWRFLRPRANKPPERTSRPGDSIAVGR